MCFLLLIIFSLMNCWTSCLFSFYDDKDEHALRLLKLTMFQFDELDSLISGIQFIEAHNNRRELYYWHNPSDDNEAVKKSYDFSNPYPFILVNIGSGVSILSVRAPGESYHDTKRNNQF